MVVVLLLLLQLLLLVQLLVHVLLLLRLMHVMLSGCEKRGGDNAVHASTIR